MLLAALSIYVVFLQPAIFVMAIFWGIGFTFNAKIKMHGPLFDRSRRATALRWKSILLGGPACTMLIACLVALIGGELRLESRMLTIGLALGAGIALMYLSRRTLMAAIALGTVHRTRGDARNLPITIAAS